jgi:hypothetical protein
MATKSTEDAKNTSVIEMGFQGFVSSVLFVANFYFR